MSEPIENLEVEERVKQDEADIDPSHPAPIVQKPAVDSEDLIPEDDSFDDEDIEEIEEIEALSGSTLDGRYLIGKELARGGMGVVFRAQHLTLNRDVVIKVLKSATVGSSSAKARFEREARRACQLDHPNIVTVHDFGYFDELGYLVMELVDGITVDDYIRQYGPMSFIQFAPVIAAICSGLAEAHRQGIVHRDIKSSNIMMNFEDHKLRRVKILDFGLAKAEGAAEDNVTRKSSLVGTMGTMPPERILCKPTDWRVDLYSLGIMAYRMITGRRPFVGEDMHVLYQHVHELPPPLTEFLPDDHDYPLHVLEWVHRLLAKEPDDRPRDGIQAREWLLETVKDKGVFRIDEGDIQWKVEGVKGPLSGTWESTDPSWSITSAPSGSYRSVINGTSAAQVVEDLRSEAAPTTAQPIPFLEQQQQQQQKAPLSRTLVFGAFAAMGLAALVAVVIISSLPNEEEPQTAEPVVENVKKKDTAGTTREVSSGNVDDVFVEIETQLNKGAFATAENLLNSVNRQLTETNQRVQAAEFQSRIDIDKNLRKAKQAEDAMAIEEAMASYDAVLSLDANNETAKNQHNLLSQKVVLKVSSDPEQGEVFVDGKPLGKAPLQLMINHDMSRVEVRHNGYMTWSTSLVPKGGTTVSLMAELERKGRKIKRSVKKKVREGQKKNTGLRNEDLIDM